MKPVEIDIPQMHAHPDGRKKKLGLSGTVGCGSSRILHRVVTVPIFVSVLCACLFAFFWLVRYPSMSKRKLRIDDGPGAQFRALRQLPGVSQELGRNIVSLLRDDDRGKGVCKRKKEIAPEACGIQVRLRDEGNPEIEIVANSLPRLIEKKRNDVHFFRVCWRTPCSATEMSSR